MDQIKHAPATPLPLSLSEVRPEPNKMYATIRAADRTIPIRVDGPDATQIAIYLVIAANAYPKLVEALREYIKADRMRDFERGQREPAFQHRRPSDAAAVLLREIGEDA